MRKSTQGRFNYFKTFCVSTLHIGNDNSS
ncbi:hypothetical protein ACFSQ3_06345 [Sphingobacterium corticis]|uniref:CRISPR-associated DxTHG motif protein n=1 Tax=Sphingobacterium corticis TaxID=1812823 RepID=A0ABW5NKX4_9SPHI